MADWFIITAASSCAAEVEVMGGNEKVGKEQKVTCRDDGKKDMKATVVFRDIN